MDTVKSHLCTEHQPALGMYMFRANRVHKVGISVPVGMAWEIRVLLLDAMDVHGLKLGG